MAGMKITEEFPKTSINRRAGDVWAAAARGPVSLSDHGTSRFVVMSRDHYDQLVGQSDPQVARATAEITGDEADQLTAVLSKVIDDDE